MYTRTCISTCTCMNRIKLDLIVIWLQLKRLHGRALRCVLEPAILWPFLVNLSIGPNAWLCFFPERKPLINYLLYIQVHVSQHKRHKCHSRFCSIGLILMGLQFVHWIYCIGTSLIGYYCTHWVALDWIFISIGSIDVLHHWPFRIGLHPCGLNCKLLVIIRKYKFMHERHYSPSTLSWAVIKTSCVVFVVCEVQNLLTVRCARKPAVTWMYVLQSNEHVVL